MISENLSSSDFSTKQHTKGFQKIWSQMPFENKKSLLLKIFQIKIINLMFDYRQIVRVVNECYPTVFQTHNYEIDRNIERLLNCDPQDFFSLISLSSIKEAQESYSYYKYEIFLALEDKIQKEQKLEPLKKEKKKNLVRTQSLKEEIIIQIQTNNQVSFTKKIPI